MPSFGRHLRHRWAATYVRSSVCDLRFVGRAAVATFPAAVATFPGAHSVHASLVAALTQLARQADNIFGWLLTRKRLRPPVTDAHAFTDAPNENIVRCSFDNCPAIHSVCEACAKTNMTIQSLGAKGKRTFERRRLTAMPGIELRSTPSIQLRSPPSNTQRHKTKYHMEPRRNSLLGGSAGECSCILCHPLNSLQMQLSYMTVASDPPSHFFYPQHRGNPNGGVRNGWLRFYRLPA